MCPNRIGPRDSSLIANAMTSISGLVTVAAMIDMITSKTRLLIP
jgi:hypothetical protein